MLGQFTRASPPVAADGSAAHETQSTDSPPAPGPPTHDPAHGDVFARAHGVRPAKGCGCPWRVGRVAGEGLAGVGEAAQLNGAALAVAVGLRGVA